MKKLNLPNNVSSPQDLTSLIQEVHEYAKWHSHNSVKKRAGSKTTKAPDISPEAKALIRDWQGNKSVSTTMLDKLIEALDEFKNTAPLLTITLAAPPTGDIKTELVGWCRKNIAPNILVRFGFSSSLLGGMVVRCGSHIYDWSFRRQIMMNRQKFPEVLRHV